MPGPKPDVRISFERIYHELSRIGRARNTLDQHAAVKRMIEAVRTAETFWFDPDIDISMPISTRSAPQLQTPPQPKVPDETDAFYAGVKAKFDGSPSTANPFEADNLHNAWNNGWESVNVEPKLP